MIRRLIELVVTIGAVKALIPSPSHYGLFEWVEFAAATMIGLVLMAFYHGKKKARATQRDTPQDGAGYPAPDAR